MAAVTVAEQARPFVTVMKARDVSRLALAGAITGLIAGLFYILFDRFIISDSFCANLGATTAGCASKDAYIGVFSLILASMAGLFMLIQQRAYRPLLVALFAIASLWGVVQVAASLPLWLMLIALCILFGLAYAAFGWLAQLRNFFLAVIIGIVSVVVMRLLFLA